MAMFAHRHSDGIEQFNEVMGAMRNAPDLVELGQDGRGDDRFTTRDMIETEQRLHRAAEMMAEKERHEVSDRDREAEKSIAPSAPSSSKLKSAPGGVTTMAFLQITAPTVSWSASRSSTRPASASMRREIIPATGPRVQRWATWRWSSNAIRNWNPC
ncbi:hypothetical protein [Amaricoccus sp.]|uniref:hypothetical protein n=1 Tax=Amaricoccus sp. TaxID=1872485 RepID=UPI0039E24224